MSALNSNNTFDGLDEPVRPTPGGRKRRLDKENHKKQQKKKVLRWRVNTHCGMSMWQMCIPVKVVFNRLTLEAVAFGVPC